MLVEWLAGEEPVVLFKSSRNDVGVGVPSGA